MSVAPVDLREYTARENTPERRVGAVGFPPGTEGWDFESFPGPSSPRGIIEAWSAAPRVRAAGLLLYGGTGLGKTGLAIAAAHAAALRGDGDLAVWNLVTPAAVERAVREGRFRRRPAPVTWRSWRELKELLDAAKMGQTSWDEDPPLTAGKVLGEVEERCALLVLDDIDVDAFTPWKEEILLRLLDFPRSGIRLVLTMNTDPTSPVGVERLGGRIIDRILDPSFFVRVKFSGPSLRRAAAMR